MSRTFRHIPYNLRYPASYLLAWEGLYGKEELYDPRDRLMNGYDGVSQSYYYDSYPPKGFRENYQYKSRRFHKRYFAKQRRREKVDFSID